MVKVCCISIVARSTVIAVVYIACVPVEGGCRPGCPVDPGILASCLSSEASAAATAEGRQGGHLAKGGKSVGGVGRDVPKIRNFYVKLLCYST